MNAKQARQIRQGITMAWQVIRYERVGPSTEKMSELTLDAYRHTLRYHQVGYFPHLPNSTFADSKYPGGRYKN